jgi:hypothetical protein
MWSDLSIDILLDMVERQGPQEILLNHLVIDDASVGAGEIPIGHGIEQLPSFTARYPGLIEVELYMNRKYTQVMYLCVRQSAMTFSELQASDDILPTLSINCEVLNEVDKTRLLAYAKKCLSLGKLTDSNRSKDLLSQYVAKTITTPSAVMREVNRVH